MPTEDNPRSADPDPAEADTPPEPPPVADPVATTDGDQSPDLLELVGRLADDLAGLRRDFDAKIRYDEVKERQFAATHEELQALRAGVHLRLLQPMFTDLIAMHDDLVVALRGDDAEPAGGLAPEVAKMLGSLKGSVLETLLRNGVSCYSVESDELDRARQQVIDVVHTPDRELDRRVMRRLRAGFEYDGGRVLRPEWVVAYRYKETHEPA